MATDPEEFYDSSSTAPLTKPERLACLLLGGLLTGTGATATFLSGNQAGSTTLILVGAAFCLMGLQGTPLIRIGGEKTTLELERRRIRATEVILNTLAEEGPERGLEIADALAAVDPGLAGNSVLTALQYERYALNSLERILISVDGRLSHTTFDANSVDAVISLRGGTLVTEVEVRFFRTDFARTDILLRSIEKRTGSTLAIPLLLIINAPHKGKVLEQKLSVTPSVKIVLWRGVRDDAQLLQAVQDVQ